MGTLAEKQLGWWWWGGVGVVVVGWWWGGVGWCGVVGVVGGGGGGGGGSDDSKHAVSLQGHADYAPFWVAEHLGASSRRPRHPFPALMAGEPLAVYQCTRPKKDKPD